MTCILITADWHLSDQPKERYRFKAMDWLLDYVGDYKVDRVIMLGDLTHNKNFHSDTLVNDVVSVLYDLSLMCPVDVLQGNHDYVEASTPFFHFVRLLKGVRWIRLPTLRQTEGLGQCCFLPHTRDYKKDWAGVKEFWDEVDIIFAHNAFEGAIAESGRFLSGIPLNIFPRGVPIISGDIHKPQDVGDNLTYVGSPFTQKHGDDFEPRVLLLENGQATSIAVPGAQKRLFDVSSLEELKRVEAKAQVTVDDMVKVRYRLLSKDRDRWSEIKQQILKVCPGAVVQPILEQQELARMVQQNNFKDDKQLLTEYGKQQSFSAAALAAGYELLNEV